jgi:aryl-alcohol dehydrogenase-like predicted oxidoreductase
MEYVTLGRTDLRVSKICLGTMTFGQQNTEAEAHEQFDYALSQGINFIDTAELYAVPARPETQGRTEKYIGTWLARRSDRDQLIIATKIAGARPFAGHIRPNLGFSRAALEEALTKSLERLQTDYVDLYQLHWPTRQTNFFGQRGYDPGKDDGWQDNFLDILRSMQELIDSGRIRHWGVSNETPWGLMRYLHLAEVHGLTPPVSIQNPYSLLNRTFEIGLSEICLRENIACLPYSPLAFGLLSGKYTRGEDTPRDRMNQFADRLPRYHRTVARQAADRYVAVAEKHGLSPAQMALAFINRQPFVKGNIIGATTMAQLVENIGSIDIELSAEVLADIEAVHDAMPNPAP